MDILIESINAIEAVDPTDPASAIMEGGTLIALLLYPLELLAKWLWDWILFYLGV